MIFFLASMPFRPILRLFQDDLARDEAYFTSAYPLAVLAMIVALSTVLYLVYRTTLNVGKEPTSLHMKAKKVLSAYIASSLVFYLLPLVRVAIRAFDSTASYEFSIFARNRSWILVAVLTAVTYAFYGHLKRLIGIVFTSALIFSPLPAILVIQQLTYESVQSVDQDVPDLDESGPALAFMIFDGLDPTTLDDQNNRGQFPAFEEFSSQSTTITASYSLIYKTKNVVPGILYQRPIDESGYVADPNDSLIFDTLGYRNRGLLAGVHVLYSDLLEGSGTTILMDKAWRPGPESGFRTFESVMFWNEFARVYEPFGYEIDRQHDNYTRELALRQFELLQDYAKNPAGRFLFFHGIAPHFPYVFDVNGPVDDTSSYEDNLRYVDRMLGQFVETLKSSGEYDDATIIVAGDHNRAWTGPGVMMIKLPHQKFASTYDSKIGTWEIGKWIASQEAYLKVHPDLRDK
ncbi:MAG: sulfatase-like hydrolase/transferase [Planctomycetota bacterium]